MKSRMPIPQRLVDAISSNQAIAFVGSGLSLPAGAPSWKELLYGLIASAEALRKPSTRPKLAAALNATLEGRFINAATIISDVLLPQEMRTAVVDGITHHKTLRPCHKRTLSAALRGARVTSSLIQQSGWRTKRCLTATRSHKILLQLNLRAVITTNYDRLLESGLGSLPKGEEDSIASYSHGSFASALPTPPGRRFILHLHGDIQHQGDIVLSWGDYNRLLSTDAFKNLKDLFATSTILWLGYSHSDPDVMQALAANGLLQLPGGFQVLEESDHELMAICEARAITPICVRSYDEMPRFLKQLATTTGARLDRSLKRGVSKRAAGGLAWRATLSRAITDRFLAAPLARLPEEEELVDPRMCHNEPGTAQERRGRKLIPDKQFACWSKQPRQAPGRQVAIVAPLGVGKTVLLSRFAQWLREWLSTRDPARGDVVPIVFFLTTDDLTEGLTQTSLWEQIERQADAYTAGYFRVENPGLLAPWRDKGRVYLLFDGVDEFGARRKGELDQLLDQLTDLAKDHRISVFLACRTVFWSQQVSKAQRRSWDEYGILPFTPAEIEKHVPYPDLGLFAYDADQRPKPGVLSQLLVSFVLALRQSKRPYEPFKSRSDLYEQWAALTASRNEEVTGLSPADCLVLFKDTALRLLRELAISVPPPELAVGRPVPLYKCLATGILMASADNRRVKFVHESLYEFFVSWVLVDSFQKVLTSATDPMALAALPLAQVDLDFLQPSVYGFLYDRLGDGYLDGLRKAIINPDLPDWKPKLLRNLVEYIGMTYKGGKDYPKVLRCLLDLIRNARLRTEIRYNAARALERIHAWAPKPYYDFMSDWGDKDWNKERRQAVKEELAPWAIRGYRIRGDEVVQRKPGKRPFLAVCRANPKEAALQEGTSSELGEIIIDLLARPADNKWLLINCTFAWARWYHSEHFSVVAQAKKLAKANRASKEIRKNLTEWVGNDAFYDS